MFSGGFNVEFKHGGFLRLRFCQLSSLNIQNKESFKLLVVIVNRSINVSVLIIVNSCFVAAMFDS